MVSTFCHTGSVRLDFIWSRYGAVPPVQLMVTTTPLTARLVITSGPAPGIYCGSGWLTTGPRTKGFEKDLAAYTGASYCVAVNSCTAALHLALEAAGVSAGDEVITSPITFASTANVIVHRGARPVFVDVEPDTFNIDPSCIERAVTPRTRALIPVDFAGQPCDLDAVMSIGARHGLPVIEDAAHSIGAGYKGRRVGGIADMTCFSFYATKNITSGEGGALTPNRQEWADRIAVMALHGISRDAWKRYGSEGYRHWDIIAPGYKYNMFDLQAALVTLKAERGDMASPERPIRCSERGGGLSLATVRLRFHRFSLSHTSLAMTQRSIEGDTEAKRKLVALLSTSLRALPQTARGRRRLYQRGRRGSRRSSRGRPRSSRGRASFTVKARPSSSCPCSPAMAARAAVSSGISTKPKPRGRPVSRSVMIRTVSTVPYDAKRSRSVCSVVVNARGSYWIPGSSVAKFCVTACFYRLSTRAVTDAASLEKAF